MQLSEILDHVTKAKLLSFCQSRKLPRSGVKDELIAEIIKNFSPKDILLELVERPILRELCQNAGLPSEGKKPELIEEILPQIISK